QYLLSIFCFKAPPPTDTSTLSLHDALPIYSLLQRCTSAHRDRCHDRQNWRLGCCFRNAKNQVGEGLQSVLSQENYATLSCKRFQDRKSTRLNSSHRTISYAVFCLKKKKK